VAASLLTYNITSNHVHLLLYAEDSGLIAERDYNRRKRRSGAFWEGRHQPGQSYCSREEAQSL
jgi:hypothetical protein